ncbi:MAG: HepT-like ribonuclease domain-containing protein [Bacteroidia bacterium]
MLPKTNNDLVFLLQILEAITKINIYSKDFNDAETFYKSNDQLNFNGSLLLIANIGEQVNKISPELKKNYPEMEWSKIKKVRNRIVHDYSGIDSEITFSIIKNEFQPLENYIYEILKTEIQKNNFDKQEIEIARQSDFYRHVKFETFIPQ